jgi:formylmethanofuran dehydrogenase subunit E
MAFLLLNLLALLPPAEQQPDSAAVERCLEAVRQYHGSVGPWAVLGYRMGQRALSELAETRHAHHLHIAVHCPKKPGYACLADGLQAATGASLGKLNLELHQAEPDALHVVITNRKTGRILVFTPRDELVQAIQNLTKERLEAEGRRVAELPDRHLFLWREQPVEGPSRKP